MEFSLIPKKKKRCLFKRGNQALRRAEGPQIQTGEEIANSVMVTIHSIFAPQDFTKQPLPELDSGLLQERFSLPLVRTDYPLPEICTHIRLGAPDTSV